MHVSRRSLVAGSAGVVVGLAISVGLVVSGALDSRGGGSASHETEAGDAFVAAYRRSLETAATVEGTFTRTMPDGRTLASGYLLAQRPPDRLRRQFGGIDGWLGGRTVTCATAPDGRFTCGAGTAAPPYGDEVERDVATVRSYLDPASPPLYSVIRRPDGCFELTQLRPVPDPTFGSAATVCFDEATGATSLLEVTREGGAVDRSSADRVRLPTDADFDTSQDHAFDQHNDDLQGAAAATTVPPAPGSPTTGG